MPAARSWRGLRLVGEFPPGEAVTVVLHENFPGHGRARLTRTERRSVRVRDLRPALRLPATGSVLSSLARPELVVEGVNVESYVVGLARTYPNNVLHLLRQGSRGESAFFAPEISQVFTASRERNLPYRHRIDPDTSAPSATAKWSPRTSLPAMPGIHT